MRDTLSGIPLPPSANNLFYNRSDGGGRHKTRDYAAWRKGAATLMAATLDPRPAATSLWVFIEVGAGRGRDIDNVVKPLLDALQVARIVPDDRWVDRINVVRSAAHHGQVTITVTTAEA